MRVWDRAGVIQPERAGSQSAPQASQAGRERPCAPNRVFLLKGDLWLQAQYHHLKMTNFQGPLF